MFGSFATRATEQMVKNSVLLSPDHPSQARAELQNPFDGVSSPGRRLEVFKSVYSAIKSEPSDDGEEEDEIVAISIQNEPGLPNPEESQTQLTKMQEQFSTEK